MAEGVQPVRGVGVVMRSRFAVLVALTASIGLAAPAHAAPPASEPPTGLRVAAATTSTVSLAWDPANGATSYQVLRGTPGTPLSTIATPTATTYLDTGLLAGTTYVYAVKAVRKAKVSPASATVTVTTVPSPPTGVTALVVLPHAVTISWTEANGAESYDIWRATDGGAPVKLGTYQVPVGGGASPALDWEDTTVSPSTTYTYTVRAVNASGTSAPSSPATVTTPAAVKMTPAVTITSSRNPAQHGDYVAYTVRVTGSEGAAVPSGAVQVSLLNQTVDLDLDATGATQLDWIFSQDGAFLVTAAYQGDADYDAATGSLTQVVEASPRLGDYQAFATGSWPESVVAADVNGDGRSEAVIVTHAYDNSVNDFSLLVHDFVPGAAGPTVTRVPAGTQYQDGLAAASGDLDADGYDDVVVATDDGVRVFRGSVDGLQPGALSTTSGRVRDVVVSDVSGDARPDVVVSVSGSFDSYAAVLAGQAGGGLGAEVRVTIAHPEPPTLAVGDFTGDGVGDVVALWRSTRTVEVLTDFALPGGTGNWDTLEAQTLPGTQWPEAVAAGDVNGDDLADVVVTAGGNRPDSRVLVLEGMPGGILRTAWALLSYDIPEPIAVTDVDGDSRADVVTAHGGWNAVGVYRQSNIGRLADEQRFSVPYASHYSPRALAVDDVTGDGKVDVLLADYNNGLVMLPGR